MEERREEERDRPADGNGYEDPNDAGEAPGGEEAAIEAEDREFYEAYGYDVPELFYEEDLWKILEPLQRFGGVGYFCTNFEEEDSLVFTQ